jgi:hypothetical protein
MARLAARPVSGDYRSGVHRRSRAGTARSTVEGESVQYLIQDVAWTW